MEQKLVMSFFLANQSGKKTKQNIIKVVPNIVGLTEDLLRQRLSSVNEKSENYLMIGEDLVAV